MGVSRQEWEPGLGALSQLKHRKPGRTVGATPGRRATAVRRWLAPALVGAAAAASVLAVPGGAARARPLPGDGNLGPSCQVDVRAARLLGGLAYHLFIIYREQGREQYFRGGPNEHLPGPSSSSLSSSSRSSIAASLRPDAGARLDLAGFIPYDPPPIDPRKVGRTIVTMHGAYKPGSKDWEPNAPSVTALKGKEACGKDRCFIAQERRINKLHRGYGSLGPNSNSVAHTLLAKCNVPAKRPAVWAPGFDQIL
jgi:hypothetical protein